MENKLALPDEKQIETITHPVLDRAKTLKVIHRDSYIQAIDLIGKIKEARTRINEAYDSHISAANKMHRDLIATKRRYETPLANAEFTLRVSAENWLAEEERARRAEEARLEAERKRIEDDAKLADAINLDHAGLKEQSEALLNDTSQSAPVKVMSSTPVIPGVSTMEKWGRSNWEVEDFAKVPNEYKILNEVAINGVVRSLKEKAKIPGIKVFATNKKLRLGSA